MTAELEGIKEMFRVVSDVCEVDRNIFVFWSLDVFGNSFLEGFENGPIFWSVVCLNGRGMCFSMYVSMVCWRLTQLEVTICIEVVHAVISDALCNYDYVTSGKDENRTVSLSLSGWCVPKSSRMCEVECGSPGVIETCYVFALEWVLFVWVNEYLWCQWKSRATGVCMCGIIGAARIWGGGGHEWKEQSSLSRVGWSRPRFICFCLRLCVIGMWESFVNILC